MAKRTNYSNELKFKVALEAIKGDVTFDKLAVKYAVSKSLIRNWRKELHLITANVKQNPHKKVNYIRR